VDVRGAVDPELEAGDSTLYTGAIPAIPVLDVVGDDVAGFFGHAERSISFRWRSLVVLGEPADVVAAVMCCTSDVEEVCFEEVGKEGMVGILSAVIRCV
jgi:hypothetical protein